MNTKSVLTMDEVAAMLAAGRAEAERNAWAVTIAVVDDGGHLLGLQRLDGAAPSTVHIGTAKARTSALGRRETKGFEDMINNGRTAFLSAPLDGFLEGGVPMIVNGQVIAAVGVSGVKSDQDAQVAKAAIAAVVAG